MSPSVENLVVRPGATPRGGRPPRGLTQELLQHLPVVQVLLQLLYDDSLPHQHVVDPVDENLRGGQALRPRSLVPGGPRR